MEILYIPHVTKIFLLAIVFLFFVLIVVERVFTFTRENLIFLFLLKWIIFIFVCIGIYNWNGVFAGWVETATFYVPHITKSFLGLVATIFVLFSGIIAPIRKNESVTYLFPFNWIVVALLRFYLDVVKAPGYIFGAIICILKTLKYKWSQFWWNRFGLLEYFQELKSGWTFSYDFVYKAKSCI